jgi:hypothetical protein
VCDLLIHWVFVAVPESSGDFKRIFEDARKKTRSEWISVLEDRRTLGSPPYSGLLVDAPMPLPPWA